MSTSVAQATRVTSPARGGLGYIPTVAFGVDLVLIAFSFVVATFGREALHLASNAPEARLSEALDVAGPMMIIGWVCVTFLFGGYRADVFGAGLDEYKRVVNSSLGTAALVGISCYATRFALPRDFFLLVFAVGIPTLLGGRFLLRRTVHRARRHGVLLHRVIIAGSEGHVDEIASVLRRETWLGYDVVGALTPQANGRPSTHSGIPILGSSERVAQVALDVEADVIFLAGGAFDSAEHMRRLAWELEDEDVQVVIAPSLTDVTSERVTVRPVGGLPLIHLERPRSEAAARRAKRSFDILAGSMLLLLCVPLLLVAALRVWRHDRGPVLVRQTRVGRGGRVFTVWNFRSTVVEADHRVARSRLDPTYAEAGLFGVENDPSTTTPGRWLRRYCIDELPQLVNVIIGDMSLVGPRAPLGHEVADLNEDDRRLRVRPGLTGVWRDFRRSDLSWSEAVTLDVHYAENWSMLQDLDLLARTTVATAHGATGSLC
jgi:exopolysaccharide biosynthesis polyprenyl glycosylphosphotransferase